MQRVVLHVPQDDRVHDDVGVKQLDCNRVRLDGGSIVSNEGHRDPWNDILNSRQLLKRSSRNEETQPVRTEEENVPRIISISETHYAKSAIWEPRLHLFQLQRRTPQGVVQQSATACLDVAHVFLKI